MHFDVAADDEKGPGGLKHITQLRHTGTGHYLSCEDKGRVKCVSFSLDSTWWWVKRANKTNQQSTSDNDPSFLQLADESTADEYILISKKYPNRKLSYARSFDDSGDDYMLITTKSIGEEKSVWTLKLTSGELCFL